MPIPTQQPAIVLEKKFGPLVLKQVDVPKPDADEVLVRIEATALNPGDWKVQAHGILVEKYPAVMGFEATGVVVEVGSAVKDYTVGDRVLFQGALDLNTGESYGTFLQYTTVGPDRMAKIPENLSFEEAATIISGLSTAALSLYNTDERAPSAKLIPPWEEQGRAIYAGKPIFLLGGATCVGQYVIQLARLSGFSPIIATASPRNADLLKSLGATHVLDRNLPSDTLLKEAREIAGGPFDVVYDAVSEPETLAVAYQATAPTGTLIAVLPTPIPGADQNSQKRVHVATAFLIMPFNRAVSRSLLAKIPELLERGEIKPTRVEVIPGGLRGVPEGLERLRKNAVSAAKLVVKPQETDV
ncbi:GroES-like protein [Trametes punicea]|nr:GroES-like protein [Trametes punicea]